MFFPTTKVKITRLIKTGTDDNGQDLFTETTIHESVDADLQPSYTKVPVYLAGQTVLADQNMFCGREVDLRENDKVYDLGNEGDNTESFKVISVNGYGLLKHIEAELVSGGNQGLVV